MLFVFIVLDLVSSVLCQEIGWEERLRNDIFVSSRTQNVNSLSQSLSLQRFATLVSLSRRSWAVHFKPNSITLASSELAPNMLEAGSRPNSITLAGSEPAPNQLA